MSYIVTTDSGCDLPIELLNERGIRPLMLHYTLNGVVETDTMVHEDCKLFYDCMREGAVPKTSQLNPQEFIDFWKPMLSEGKPIVHISLASGVSGTWANGVAAAEQLKEECPEAEITVIDSTLCSTGYGMLALKAAELKDSGASYQQCVQWLQNNKLKIQPWYTTDDLTYLRRSGRCSKASAIIGTALSICPILNLDATGHLTVKERVRGFGKTLKRIRDIIAQSVVDPQNQTLYICHSDIEQRAREFGESLKNDLGFKDVYYTYIGTIIGSNCGPGLMAAFFVGKERTMDD